MKLKLAHVAEMSTWDSGGGQLLDLIILRDGRVLVISEDAIVLYNNMAEVEEGIAGERPTIFL